MPPTQAPGKHPSRNPFRSLSENRELLWQFTLRTVELRHRGSHLGIIWAVLNPLLLLGLYVFVFAFIFKGSFHAIPNETRWDYSLGIFLGLTIFHLIGDTLAVAPMMILMHINFVKKVVFPLEILPVAHAGAACIHFLISLALVLIGVATVGPGFAATIVWLPLVIVPVIAITVGISWMLSALGVFIRDITQIVQALNIMLLFASAVFYQASTIKQNAPAAWAVLRFNPILVAIDIARDATLWHRTPDLGPLIFLYSTGAATFVIGYWLFNRLRPGFADVL